MLPMGVMLRDRVVCGLRDEHLQQRLFVERDLTFLKVFDVGVRAENARHDQRQIRFQDFNQDFREVKADVSRPAHQKEVRRQGHRSRREPRTNE